MALNSRERKFNRLIDQMEAADKGERHTKVIRLADRIAVEYEDLLDLDKELHLKSISGIACVKAGKYGEAQSNLGDILEYNFKSGIPVADSQHMYWWLRAHRHGDDKKAFDEFTRLRDDQTAINMIREVEEMRPVTQPTGKGWKFWKK